MMKEEQPSGSDPTREDLFFRHREGYIDFFRAFRRRSASPADVPPPKVENLEAVHATATCAWKLVEEYGRTATRVGRGFDPELFQEVVAALRCDARGAARAHTEISRKDNIERFLAESLYREILELSPRCQRPSAEQARPLSAEDWQICLDLLEDTLAPQQAEL